MAKSTVPGLVRLRDLVRRSPLKVMNSESSQPSQFLGYDSAVAVLSLGLEAQKTSRG